MKNFFRFFLLVWLATCTCIQPVFADAQQLDASAKAVFKANLDLQTLVEQYHLAAAVRDYNRSKRLWFYDIFNAISTEAGLIDSFALNFAHSNDQTVNVLQPVATANGTVYVETQKNVRAHIPRSKIAGTLYPQIAGQVVDGTGTLVESGLDIHHFFKLRSERYLRKQITRRVADKVKAINSLIEEYELNQPQKLSNEANNAAYERAAYVVEATVMRAMLANTVAEFLRLEHRATLMSSANLIDDNLSFLRNTVGAVGNSLNVAAAFKESKRLNGQGAICNLVSASMIITRPLFTTVGSNLTALRCAQTQKLLKKWTNEDFDLTAAQTNTTLHTAMEDLTSVGTKYDDAILANRIQLYTKELVECDKQNSLALTEQKKWNHIVARRLRETAYGPTKATQSSISLVVNFRKLDNTTKDARLNAAGNLTYASGQALNILELVRERVIDSSDHNRDRELGQLPEQQIARSLQNIQQMQQSMTQ